jgi:hypothetical protein
MAKGSLGRQGIAEINLAPVVHRWKKFDALFAQKDMSH